MPSREYIRTDELLTTAAFRGDVERVRQMLAHGASSSARSDLKTTALHWAISMGHVEVAELLVEHGADVNARAADGNSPLHVAAKEGDADCVNFLLASGASPVLCNATGSSALDLALSFADDEVELIHMLRTAQKSHENKLLVHQAAVGRASEGRTSGSTENAVRPKMVSSGCGPDSELSEPMSSPKGAEVAVSAPKMVSGGCGPDTTIPDAFTRSCVVDNVGGGAIASKVSSTGSTCTLSGDSGKCSFARPDPALRQNAVPVPPPPAPDTIDAAALAAAVDKLGF